MAKKKVASVVVGSLGKGHLLGKGTDPKVITPTPGWSQREVEYLSTHLPPADGRVSYGGEKVKNSKKPKVTEK